MFIDEIFDKKLKKPMEVRIENHFLATNDDICIFGEGDTEKEAIEDFKAIVLDVYEHFKKYPDQQRTKEGKRILKKHLAYFEQ